MKARKLPMFSRVDWRESSIALLKPPRKVGQTAQARDDA
jgi:hypothetical protein